MGSEGENSDFNQMIFIAVGRNVKKGKSLLNWAVKNPEGKNICLLHVHQPANSFSLLNGKPSGSKLKNHAIKACLEFERLKMRKLMRQYLDFLSQMGIQSDKVWIEANNVEKGIIQLISQHSVRWLIMGAEDDTFCTKKSSEIKSSMPMVVCQQAPPSCHVWFICKGSLIYTRPVDSGSLLTSTVTLSSSKNSDQTIITHDPEEKLDPDTEEIVCTINPTFPAVIQTSGDDSPLLVKSKFLENLSSSSSNTSQESEFQEEEMFDIHDKLESVMIGSENSKHIAFEESLRYWRAKEDELEAAHKAEAAESPCKEKLSRNQEIEELLISQRKEMETIKEQQSQILKEINLIKDQKPALESQLREAYCLEKEMEDKIIQAVNLLITFKEKRDKLKIEYDSAIRKVNRLRTLQIEDPTGISSTHFFGISFSYITEATQTFDPSHIIGEGRYGTVFKGMLCNVKVAIMMLPSSGSQSDLEFKHEAEILSRVRHPNLVTLIGVCPESRALIYEHIENNSLEDYLSNPAKASSLSWQTRIRIAVDICSVLLFLHGDMSRNVHGDLKPSNIFLDGNFVSKISGFGIHNIISQNKDTFNSHNIDPQILAYMEPEYFENGELTTESDIYSFGMILLRLLTRRSAIQVVRDVKCALESGHLDTVLDVLAGDWPLKEAKEFADLALRCCEKDPLDRPDLMSEIWGLLEPMREMCNVSQLNSTSSSCDSRNQHKIPSHFVCPIYQEVMEDPHIAADGYTYEGDAIKGWFNSGHDTSPMTNLKLDNCDLLPNNAIFYAIRAWQQTS